jgi:uncharacterized protein (TIGR01777 family)
MQIFLVGGTGYIGRLLFPSLIQKGYEVTLLVSNFKNKQEICRQAEVVVADSGKPGSWQKNMVKHDIIINLAGTSIFQRWNDRVKNQIVTSRIQTTKNIVDALKKCNEKTKHLFNASGVGYYGYDQEALFDERSSPGSSFLASVARDWEEEALKAQSMGIRTVLCRFGIVMGRGGGALKNMLPFFKSFCGGTWGNGRQWFSWIHENDLIETLLFLLRREQITGPVNLTAPNPIQNREMARVLRKVISRRSFIPVIPAFLIKFLLGEFSEVFLKGQKVIPKKLIDNEFSFQFPDFEICLRDLLG